MRPTAVDEERDNSDLAARITSLSPRRIMALTGAFIAALAALMFLQLREEGASRRTETALRVDKAASECASALNIAIMTGGSIRQTLAACHPGGRAALFHLSPTGDILTAQGAGEGVDLDAATAATLPIGQRGAAVLDLAGGRAAASWRPLDNGESILAMAPARDIYGRTPVWVGYGLILIAISMVVLSLMAAFLKQSLTAAEAATAIDALARYTEALKGGRASPWFYDGKSRTVTLARALLEPLGLGARDRVFTMREISALVHPDDLRAALAILTGETSGVSEGAVRLREPSGNWSRIYLRTGSDAARFSRAGVAFDLAGAKTMTPSAAIAESRLKDAIENIPEAFVLWDAHGRLAIPVPLEHGALHVVEVHEQRGDGALVGLLALERSSPDLALEVLEQVEVDSLVGLPGAHERGAVVEDGRESGAHLGLSRPSTS